MTEDEVVQKCIDIAMAVALEHENFLKSMNSDTDWRWEQGGFSTAHRIAREIRRAFQ